MNLYKTNLQINIFKIKYNQTFSNKLNFDEIFYICKNSFFLLNKIRRLMVARTKRILKKKSITKIIWFKLGKLVSIFKKGLNMRMGKGDGSFFSVRRFYQYGSYILTFRSKRHGFNKFIFRYVKAKLNKNITIYIKKKYNFFKFKLRGENLKKQKTRFFKKSKKFFRRFLNTFKLKQAMLWLLTNRFYRKYKNNVFKISNFSKLFIKFRFWKYKNNKKMFKYNKNFLFKKKFLLTNFFFNFD